MRASSVLVGRILPPQPAGRISKRAPAAGLAKETTIAVTSPAVRSTASPMPAHATRQYVREEEEGRTFQTHQRDETVCLSPRPEDGVVASSWDKITQQEEAGSPARLKGQPHNDVLPLSPPQKRLEKPSYSQIVKEGSQVTPRKKTFRSKKLVLVDSTPSTTAVEGKLADKQVHKQQKQTIACVGLLGVALALGYHVLGLDLDFFG